MTGFGAFLMTFFNSLQSEGIHISEQFKNIIDSVNGLVRKTMLYVSSNNSLEHISLIFHGNAVAISGKNLFENCNDYVSENQ